MGRPKALLPWMGTTLLDYQLSQLSLSLVDDVVLVLGHGASELRPHAAKFPKVRIMVNAEYGKGRATSVVVGVKALGDRPQAILVLGVDQPRPAAIINEVMEAHVRGPELITVPTFRGQRGHPVAFDGSLMDEMKGITEEGRGLKEVVHRDPGRVGEVEVSSPAILLDLNTPQDYERGMGIALFDQA